MKALYNPQEKRRYKIKNGIGFFRQIRDYDMAKETKPILLCNCKAQICCGKFLQIKTWQKFCQWEEVRLKHATDITLEINIYESSRHKNKSKS
jgi:hypothetical protein